MPAMDHVVRSESGTARFKNIIIKEDSLPLWVQILWTFSWELVLQWLGILFSNFFDVAPAFATLQLLKYLETRKDINDLDPGAWKYVAGIITATVSSFIVDSRLWWWVMTGTFDFRGSYHPKFNNLFRYIYTHSISSQWVGIYEVVEDKRLKHAPRGSKLLFRYLERLSIFLPLPK